MWDIPEDHDVTNRQAAYNLLQQEGLPLGILYQNDQSESLDQRVEVMRGKAPQRSADQQLAAFRI